MDLVDAASIGHSMIVPEVQALQNVSVGVVERPSEEDEAIHHCLILCSS